MSSPFHPRQADRGAFLLAKQQEARESRRAAAPSAYDRSVAIALALRGLRIAHALTAVETAIEDILARYVAAESFAILEPQDDSWRSILARGLEPGELARLTSTLRGPSYAALAWCPLRAAGNTFGWLAIYRLVPTKRSLDAFDLELIDALAPFMAVAFEAARAHAARPTERPQSVTRLRIK